MVTLTRAFYWFRQSLKSFCYESGMKMIRTLQTCSILAILSVTLSACASQGPTDRYASKDCHVSKCAAPMPHSVIKSRYRLDHASHTARYPMQQSRYATPPTACCAPVNPCCVPRPTPRAPAAPPVYAQAAIEPAPLPVQSSPSVITIPAPPPPPMPEPEPAPVAPPEAYPAPVVPLAPPMPLRK